MYFYLLISLLSVCALHFFDFFYLSKLNSQQCLGDLVCYHRNVNDTLPGDCIGIDLNTDIDVCWTTHSNVEGPPPPPTPAPPVPGLFQPTIEVETGYLNLCEGDCDTDDDCIGDLICEQRVNGDPIHPECSGRINSATDFCVPKSFTIEGPAVNDNALANIDLGNETIIAGYGMELCESDCDRDDDCQGDLICHQRDTGDLIPNMCSGDRSSSSDFCVPPDYNPIESFIGQISKSFRLKIYWQKGYNWQGSFVSTELEEYLIMLMMCCLIPSFSLSPFLISIVFTSLIFNLV